MSIRRLSWFNSSRGVYPSLPCLEQAALLQDDIWSTWHICSNIKYFPKLFAGYLIIPFHIYFAWLKLTIWTAEIVLYETFRICLIWWSYYCLIHFTKRCVSQPAMPRASSTSAGSYRVHLTYQTILINLLRKVRDVSVMILMGSRKSGWPSHWGIGCQYDNG